MRRLLLLLTTALVMAVMLLASAIPAFANTGGFKPPNYGDCTSAVATGNLFVPVTTQQFAKNTAPIQSQGQGNQGELHIVCSGYPPPS